MSDCYFFPLIHLHVLFGSPAQSYILDLSPLSHIWSDISQDLWDKLVSSRPHAVKRKYHNEIKTLILHLFENVAKELRHVNQESVALTGSALTAKKFFVFIEAAFEPARSSFTMVLSQNTMATPRMRKVIG